MKRIYREIKGNKEHLEINTGKAKIVVTSKDGIPEGTFVFGYGKTGLDGYADVAEDFIQFQKSQLTEIPRAILNLEEQLRKELEFERDEKGYLGIKGRWFYTIKSSKPQPFLPKLDEILENAYSGITKELSQKYESATVQGFVEYRKQTVKEAILKEIKDHRMEEVTKKYEGGICTEKEVIANIEFGERTWALHIFNPISDMTIVARVGGSYSSDRGINDICISKDVFVQPPPEEMRNSNYLANLLGYKNKAALLKCRKFSTDL